MSFKFRIFIYPLWEYCKYGYNTSCKRIILTEFYSFCYLLIILLLLFKIRNKIIDLAVCVINFILIILFYYMLEGKKYFETGKDYTFYKNFWFN